ncbi:MAG: hypothetical protein F4209_10835 [Chloroflexi bacterium]|nr:hypothetical protein [Chloroflexota bacterium]
MGVDCKTVWRALDAGRLTPWLRNALERERLAEEREAAGEDQVELPVEGLERRLREVEGRLASDLGSLRDEVKTLAWTLPELGGTASDAASTSSAPPSPHRTHLQVVTVEPLPDDADAFGEAMPLIAGWREQRASFNQHWPSVKGLEAEVRMLELELELIKERKLTLPRARLPWEWDQRRREARRRAQRLGTARRNLRRSRWRRWLLRVIGIRLLRA